MLLTKTVRLPYPFDRMTFFVTDEILRDTEAQTIYKRSLFLADDASPNGMKLVLQEELVDDGSILLRRRR